MSDPRPGFEEVSPRHGWLAGWGWALVVGLAMGLLIFLGPADDRAHLLGGTTRTDTTVVDARLETAAIRFFPLAGSIAWIAAGRRRGPRRRTRARRPFPEWVTRPGRAAATDPASDEEFLLRSGSGRRSGAVGTTRSPRAAVPRRRGARAHRGPIVRPSRRRTAPG